jgi:hypothetical protein
MSLEREVLGGCGEFYGDLQVKVLKHLQDVPFIPRIFWSGVDGTSNVMVLQLLGRDLTYYLK